jgi:DNA-binding LacI/PurR family transcriptional regulator
MHALDAINPFTILKVKQSAQEQITDYVREEICKGHLKPGVKLPSTQELATRWETNLTTVQRAMGPLVKEGLLVRVPCVGTFVREREEKLTCVGVYCGKPAHEMPFSNAINSALREELRQAGIELDVWVDPRPLEQHGEPWAPLVKAAEQRRFQAFIGTELSISLLRWQEKLPVPTVFMGAPSPIPNSVNHDLRQFVEISLRELARQGCRSVGFIAPLLNDPDALHPRERRTTSLSMLEHFTNVAGDLGLTLKNEWMRVFQHDPLEPRGQEHFGYEQFGYEQFLQIWSQPEKPEGLLVFTDIIARGVILAVREKQVRVPEELKLALSKNETIDLFCPMPATFVVASEREMARALIGQVQKQFNGETCERISLPFRIVAHNNLQPKE